MSFLLRLSSSSPMAAEYVPQLATLTKTPPSGDEWVHEIKLDGYRVGCLDRRRPHQVDQPERTRLDGEVSGNRRSRFARSASQDALIDGELVVMLPSGRSSFEAMQQAVASGVAPEGARVFRVRSDPPGRRTHRPAAARRAKGPPAVAPRTHRRRDASATPSTSRDVAADVFDQACRMGLEGIISKRRDLPYQPGRRDGWRKIKCLRRGLFVIGGFTDQEGSQRRARRSARRTLRRQEAGLLRARRHRIHPGTGARPAEAARVDRAARRARSIHRHQARWRGRRTGSSRRSSAKRRSSSRRPPACFGRRRSRASGPRKPQDVPS